MHDDCIARGSLVRGILCKVRLNPSFFRDSRLLCNICLCTSKVTYIVLRTSMLLGRPELNWPDVLRISPSNVDSLLSRVGLLSFTDLQAARISQNLCGPVPTVNWSGISNSVGHQHPTFLE